LDNKNYWSINQQLYRFFSKIIPVFKKDKTTRSLYNLLKYSLFLILVVISIEISFFYFLGFEIKNIGDIGALGDFFGGLLNPIFMLVTFMGLIITIIIQKKELSETREEFKLQTETFQLQQFDSNFFQMIQNINKIRDEIINNVDDNFEKLFRALTQKIEALEVDNSNFTKSINDNFLNKFANYNYSKQDTYRYYMLNLYQISNYVYNSKLDEKKSKVYSNILRAQLSPFELKLLFFNIHGIKPISGNSYCTLTEKYSFFEHMNYKDIFSDFFNLEKILKSDINTPFKTYFEDQEFKDDGVSHFTTCELMKEAAKYDTLVILIMKHLDVTAFGNNEKLVEIYHRIQKVDELDISHLI